MDSIVFFRLVIWTCVAILSFLSSQAICSCVTSSDPVKITAVQSVVVADYNLTKFITIEARLNQPYNPNSFRVYVILPNGDENQLNPESLDLCLVRYLPFPLDYSDINNTVEFVVKAAIGGNILDKTFTILIFEVAADVQDFNSPFSVLEYEKFIINCSAIGNPPPNINWDIAQYKNQLNQDAAVQTEPVEIYDISATRSLRIINATKSANFTCLANNVIGNGTEYKSSSKTARLNVDIPIALVETSNNISVTEVTPMTLSCLFRSNPAPNETKWTGVLSSQEFIFYDGVFTNMSVTISTSQCEGIIRCQATNYVLQEEIPYTDDGSILITLQSPSSVENFATHAEDCNGTYFYASWDKPQGWSSELSYNVTVTNSSNQRIFNTEKTSIVISSAPNTTYMVEVIALTNCGKFSDSQRESVKTGITVPSGPQNVVATEDSEEKLCTITWEEPELTFNNLTGYKLTYDIVDSESSSQNVINVEASGSLSHVITMDKENSNYTASVTALNCAGESESVEAKGVCFRNVGNINRIAGVLITIAILLALILENEGLVAGSNHYKNNCGL